MPDRAIKRSSGRDSIPYSWNHRLGKIASATGGDDGIKPALARLMDNPPAKPILVDGRHSRVEVSPLLKPIARPHGRDKADNLLPG